MNSDQNNHVRESDDFDTEIIMMIERKAFGSEVEPQLVLDLLDDQSAKPILSLLAFKDEVPVGHILFTKALIESNEPSPFTYILAPIAVRPEYQGQGIGSSLVEEGLKRLHEMGAELVFVLGHERYYPRFGFVPNASGFGFMPPYTLQPHQSNAWMVQSLNSKGLEEYPKGRIVCANAMDKPEYWYE